MQTPPSVLCVLLLRSEGGADMGQFSSDEELHQAVNAFAFENAVNYSEALKAVDEIERAKEYRNSDTVQRGIVTPQDADFHAAAAGGGCVRASPKPMK